MHCNILVIALCNIFCSFFSLCMAPLRDCYFSLITVRHIALERVSMSVWLRLGSFPNASTVPLSIPDLWASLFAKSFSSHLPPLASPGPRWASQVGINKEETPQSFKNFIVSQGHHQCARHPVCLLVSGVKASPQLLCKMKGSLWTPI